MRNYHFAAISSLALLLAWPLAAQEADEADAGDTPLAEAAGAEEADDADDADLFEDSDLDEQTYEEDDDDFVPTEEIPADEPIPFPTNI